MKIHASVRIFTRDLQAWLLIKRAKIRFRRGAHGRAAMAWWFLEVGGGPLVSAAAVCEDTRCRHLLRRRENSGHLSGISFPSRPMAISFARISKLRPPSLRGVSRWEAKKNGN